MPDYIYPCGRCGETTPLTRARSGLFSIAAASSRKVSNGLFILWLADQLRDLQFFSVDGKWVSQRATLMRANANKAPLAR